jgi:hypothetical protein
MKVILVFVNFNIIIIAERLMRVAMRTSLVPLFLESKAKLHPLGPKRKSSARLSNFNQHIWTMPFNLSVSGPIIWRELRYAGKSRSVPLLSVPEKNKLVRAQWREWNRCKEIGHN